MTMMSTEKLIVAAQIAVVSAITWAVLYFIGNAAGRSALWIIGLLLLLFAGWGLFRLRKKV